AARTTTELITESVENAEGGVKITAEVAELLKGIMDGATKVNSLVKEIDAASKEQATGIEQVNTAVAEMNKVTQQNAANSEESASASEELNGQAEEMNALVGDFKISYQGSTAPARTVKKKPAPREKAVTKKKTTPVKKTTAEKVIPMDDDDFSEF
ncbi:MAG: methyl-accepting chemotaxis protein, partial [Fidelibacterota bacterium]